MRESPGTPRPDDTKTDDETTKVHRAETKTRTPVEAKRQGPTLDDVKKDERVKVYIRSANSQTGAIGYTEHGERHANTTADGARFILTSLAHAARPTGRGPRAPLPPRHGKRHHPREARPDRRAPRQPDPHRPRVHLRRGRHH